MSTRGIIGLVLCVGAFYLVMISMWEGGAYFLTVDEVQAAKSQGKTKNRLLRIKGNVAHGSHQNTEGSSEHRFVVEGEINTIPVYYKGPIPDVFKEGGEVVATGRLDTQGLFTATEVTAKCPSKYEQEQISPEARKYNNLDQPREMK